MLYQYRCASQHVTEKMCRYVDYEEAVPCDECELAAVRIFTPPVMVKAQPDIAYDSPIDGRHITTHAARREDMQRHNCIEYDPEMKKDADRRTKERQDALDRSVEQTVEREIAKMPSAKRAQLKKEVVDMGVGLEVKR